MKVAFSDIKGQKLNIICKHESDPFWDFRRKVKSNKAITTVQCVDCVG